jgi:hypothetical protein
MAVIAGERAKNTKTSHLKNVNNFHSIYCDSKGVHLTKIYFHINKKIIGTLNDAANIRHLEV